ncbi:hypothetical protein SEA_LIBERTYBELL_58 [Streptomyces phage LibertyBell]|nr:hypothetical protein SEA_LIBERTYBELL_58 [Streptomyces phage LibertyBell]
MNDDILLILGAMISVIWLGYAALIGVIESKVGGKKLAKEVTALRSQLAEFQDARAFEEPREQARCYFNQYMETKDKEVA